MCADFLDTNILVYMFADNMAGKSERSRDLVRNALAKRTAVISYQVVQEFLNVATRKFEPAMSSDRARSFLQSVLMPLCVVWPSASLYRSALEIHGETHFGFYDSLVLAGAVEAKCVRLLTEDLQHDRTVRGVRIVNPYLD